MFFLFDHQGLVRKILLNKLNSFLQGYSKKNQQVLIDYGCGDMPYKEIITNNNFEYIPLDIEADYNNDEVIKIKTDEKTNLPEKTADILLSVQVLEHVPNLEQYLREAKRLLKDDGRLVLSTHGVWLYHPHPGDYRRWTHQGLCHELKNHGFEICNIEGILGPLAWTTQMRLLGIFAITKDIPLLFPCLKFLLFPFMNILMLLEELITPKNIRFQHACIYFLVAKKI